MPGFEDPVDVFNAAVEALASGNVERFGECFDPRSLDQLRRQILESLRGEPHRVTADEIMRHDKNMPREVAEYQVAQLARYGAAERLKDHFLNANSVEDVEAMTPAAFYCAYVDAHGMKRQIKRLVDQGRAPERILEQFEEPRPVAIGSVSGGDRVAWVVFRDSRGEFRPTEEWLQYHPEQERGMAIDLASAGHPHFQSCYRQTDGSWKLVADFTGFGRGQSSIVSVRDTSGDAE